MNVVYENVGAMDAATQAKLDGGVAAMNDVGADLRDITVIITGDMQGSIEKVWDEKGLPAPHANPLRMGIAIENIVLINLQVTEKGQASVSSIFQHETWHILLRQRGDWSNGRIPRSYVASDDMTHLMMATLASAIIEEHRIETVVLVNDNAYFFESYCIDANRRSGAFYALTKRALDDGSSTKVWGHFKEMVLATGYMASKCIINGFRPFPMKPRSIEEIMLGPVWLQLIAALEQIPSATVAMTEEEIVTAIKTISEILLAWFSYLGFTITSQTKEPLQLTFDARKQYRLGSLRRFVIAPAISNITKKSPPLPWW